MSKPCDLCMKCDRYRSECEGSIEPLAACDDFKTISFEESGVVVEETMPNGAPVPPETQEEPEKEPETQEAPQEQQEAPEESVKEQETTEATKGQEEEDPETKSEKFIRISGRRLPKALDEIRKLKNLTYHYLRKRTGIYAYTYEWTSDQAADMVSQLREAVDELEKQLTHPKENREGGLV